MDDSPEGLAAWLGPGRALEDDEEIKLGNGTSGKVRVYKSGSHKQLAWTPTGWPRASTLQVRVIDIGDRSVMGFHQEHLPSQAARRARKAHFKSALAQMEALAE